MKNQAHNFAELQIIHILNKYNIERNFIGESTSLLVQAKFIDWAVKLMIDATKSIDDLLEQAEPNLFFRTTAYGRFLQE